MSTPAAVLSNNIRIAAFTMVAYDYLQTVPGELRFYRKHWQARRISLVLVMFVIMRYMSILAILTNAMGLYGTRFTQESCRVYYMLPLVSKLLAGLAAQMIILQRTYNIASRSRMVLAALVVLSVLLLPLQALGNGYARGPKAHPNGSCTTSRTPGSYNYASLYYLGNLIFDVVACAIATSYLMQSRFRFGRLSTFNKKLLQHGLFYAFGTTVTNLLVFLAVIDVPGIRDVGGAFLSIAVTMILAQRLVLATAHMDDNLNGHLAYTYSVDPTQAGVQTRAGLISDDNIEKGLHRESTTTDNGRESSVRKQSSTVSNTSVAK